jgi:hypothetical protein
MTFDNFAGFDGDIGVMAAIARREMPRRMFEEKHLDGDAIEVSDGRHEVATVKVRPGLDGSRGRTSRTLSVHALSPRRWVRATYRHAKKV